MDYIRSACMNTHIRLCSFALLCACLLQTLCQNAFTESTVKLSTRFLVVIILCFTPCVGCTRKMGRGRRSETLSTALSSLWCARLVLEESKNAGIWALTVYSDDYTYVFTVPDIIFEQLCKYLMLYCTNMTMCVIGKYSYCRLQT